MVYSKNRLFGSVISTLLLSPYPFFGCFAVHASSSSSSTPVRILESRTDYRSCHIRLPDAQERVAAIAFQNRYYSFFRVERDRSRAIEISNRLISRGYTVILTKVPKTYAIWVWEPDAEPEEARHSRLPAEALTSFPPRPGVSRPLASPAPVEPLRPRVLSSPTQYRSCQIRVPDLDKRLAAIYHEGSYYSLFKSVDNIDQAVELIKRLHYRGDESLITQTGNGYTLWILEPEAIA